MEALLFVASESLPISRLEVLTEGIKREKKSLRDILVELEREYEEEGRGFTIRKVANGYQLRTRDIYSPWIRKLFHTRRVVHLSKAALETLAIIAYKQPITRIEIEVIRGVNVFPSQIEQVLMRIEETEPHYEIVVDRGESSLDEVEIHVEVEETFFSDETRSLEKVREKIEREMKAELGIGARIKLVEPKSIARSEGKAVRVIDNRKI